MSWKEKKLWREHPLKKNFEEDEIEKLKQDPKFSILFKKVDKKKEEKGEEAFPISSSTNLKEEDIPCIVKLIREESFFLEKNMVHVCVNSLRCLFFLNTENPSTICEVITLFNLDVGALKKKKKISQLDMEDRENVWNIQNSCIPRILMENLTASVEPVLCYLCDYNWLMTHHPYDHMIQRSAGNHIFYRYVHEHPFIVLFECFLERILLRSTFKYDIKSTSLMKDFMIGIMKGLTKEQIVYGDEKLSDFEDRFMKFKQDLFSKKTVHNDSFIPKVDKSLEKLLEDFEPENDNNHHTDYITYILVKYVWKFKKIELLPLLKEKVYQQYQTSPSIAPSYEEVAYELLGEEKMPECDEIYVRSCKCGCHKSRIACEGSIAPKLENTFLRTFRLMSHYEKIEGFEECIKRLDKLITYSYTPRKENKHFMFKRGMDNEKFKEYTKSSLFMRRVENRIKMMKTEKNMKDEVVVMPSVEVLDFYENTKCKIREMRSNVDVKGELERDGRNIIKTPKIVTSSSSSSSADNNIVLDVEKISSSDFETSYDRKKSRNGIFPSCYDDSRSIFVFCNSNSEVSGYKVHHTEEDGSFALDDNNNLLFYLKPKSDELEKISHVFLSGDSLVISNRMNIEAYDINNLIESKEDDQPKPYYKNTIKNHYGFTRSRVKKLECYDGRLLFILIDFQIIIIDLKESSSKNRLDLIGHNFTDFEISKSESSENGLEIFSLTTHGLLIYQYPSPDPKKLFMKNRFPCDFNQEFLSVHEIIDSETICVFSSEKDNRETIFSLLFFNRKCTVGEGHKEAKISTPTKILVFPVKNESYRCLGVLGFRKKPVFVLSQSSNSFLYLFVQSTPTQVDCVHMIVHSAIYPSFISNVYVQKMEKEENSFRMASISKEKVFTVHTIQRIGGVYEEEEEKIVDSSDDGKRCHYCTVQEGMMRCSVCKVAHYCSRNYQKRDWKRHKMECRKKKTRK